MRFSTEEPCSTGARNIRPFRPAKFPVRLTSRPHDEPVTVYLCLYGLNAPPPSPRQRPDLSIQQNVLPSLGERTLQQREDGTYFRQERFSGPFRRVVALPDDVLDKVEARYVDGIVQITVGRRPTEQPRRIDVQWRRKPLGEHPVSGSQHHFPCIRGLLARSTRCVRRWMSSRTAMELRSGRICPGCRKRLNVRVMRTRLRLEGDVEFPLGDNMQALYADVRSNRYGCTLSSVTSWTRPPSKRTLKDGVLDSAHSKARGAAARKIEVQSI